jgi:hypothetical protein
MPAQLLANLAEKPEMTSTCLPVVVGRVGYMFPIQGYVGYGINAS